MEGDEARVTKDVGLPSTKPLLQLYVPPSPPPQVAWRAMRRA